MNNVSNNHFSLFTVKKRILWRCFQSTGRPWTDDLYKSVRSLYSKGVYWPGHRNGNWLCRVNMYTGRWDCSRVDFIILNIFTLKGFPKPSETQWTLCKPDTYKDNSRRLACIL